MSTTIKSRSLRILVVEANEELRAMLVELLAAEGYAVDQAVDGASALDRVADQPPDIILSDLQMPGMDGMERLQHLRARSCEAPVIIITSTTDIDATVAAMRAGAADFLRMPFGFASLDLAIIRALQHREVRLEAENLRRQLDERNSEGLRGMLGSSAPMQEIYRTARKVAGAIATVLITGESGTGKGEAARAIHALGPRAERPFVAVHCSALSEGLLESELFGHERGAFTGADRRRIGRFEQADGGTLFLDEIGEIAPQTQVKLLTFLQDRTFQRVGGNDTIAVDVRIIAATNRDLAADVAAGRFREDLYYRLKVVGIEMPALRSRGGDVLALADHFLRTFARENHKQFGGFTDRARAAMRRHTWPGNVREFENAIERAVVLSEGDRLDEEHFGFAGQLPPASLGEAAPGLTLAAIERQAILAALEASDGSTARAAEILDISVRMIQYRLHEYGIARERGPLRGAEDVGKA